MSKYIKLDDAIDYECPFNEIWEDCIGCPLNDSAIETCKMGKWLKSLPATEIVRCKDCKHFSDGDCTELPKIVSENDFCSYAEKQVTSKLKNADDSLFTVNLDGIKEQKSELESEKVQLSPETPTNKVDTPTNTPTDLISRQAAIDAVEKAVFKGVAKSAIESLPPVEPNRPKGEWIIHGEPPWYVRECTKCGSKWFHHVSDDKPNFCANCGADMRG